MFVAAAALAAATFAGAPSPALILGLTFAMGCGNAVASPAWQAIQPDLVDRPLLPQAAALNGLNMNVARAVGPAIGGFVVAAVGPGWVFALNAVSFIGIAVTVACWRSPAHTDTGPPERLVEALRAGGRYVRHSPTVRRLLYRAVLFIPAAGALWALLPVVAARNLHLGSAGYGVMLGAVGIGAVLGALVIPRVRARLGSARLVTGAMLLAAGAIAVVATVGDAVGVGIALLPVGAAWIAVLSSLNSALQLALPNWVRGRGLAYYLIVFQGAQALGALVWGTVADRATVSTALLVAAGDAGRGRRRRAAQPPAEHRRPGPDALGALARAAADRHAGARGRPDPGHPDLPRRRGRRRRVHRGDAARRPLAAAHRGAALGAVPRRRRPDPLRRVVPGRHLGRAPAPARGPADRRRPPVRGAGAGLRAEAPQVAHLFPPPDEPIPR